MKKALILTISLVIICSCVTTNILAEKTNKPYIEKFEVKTDNYLGVKGFHGPLIDVKNVADDLGGHVRYSLSCAIVKGQKHYSIYIDLSRKSWVFMDTLYDVSGERFEPSSNPSRNIHRGSIFEQAHFKLDQKYLENRRNSGLNFKVFGGGYIIKVPAEYVKALLDITK